MISHHTNEEWLGIFKQAEQGNPSTFAEYNAPGLQSEEFAKSIDHTLLKLEATESQIDALCEEAKEYNFKVIMPNVLFETPSLSSCYVHHLVSLVLQEMCTNIRFPDCGAENNDVGRMKCSVMVPISPCGSW